MYAIAFLVEIQVEEFLAELAVEDLPGVGWTLKERLHSHNLRKCPDLRRVSKVPDVVIVCRPFCKHRIF